MKIGKLEIADVLHTFVNDEVLPGTDVSSDEFWASLENIVAELGPRNAALLARRDELQEQIDQWHRDHADHHDGAEYADFLRSIGYLDYQTEPTEIATTNVDIEITTVAGPQLVVPLDNARYALNAANARWGSLYDALYGTDAIDQSEGASPSKRYNPIRGRRVVAWGRDFLDRHFSLDQASHHWSVKYTVSNGALHVESGDGVISTLLRPERFVGYTGSPEAPDTIMLQKNGMRCELVVSDDHVIGKTDPAGIADIRLESAISTIMDCEDSVSAVDADDKVTVYGNWLGLMKGDLVETFEKGDETVRRELAADMAYKNPAGEDIVVRGRTLMLVRNVGPHLSTDAVLYDGEPIFETMLDAMVTTAAAKHDLLGKGVHTNSAEGSVYIVKPKMHGPEEVQLNIELFGMVEDALGLERNTMKIGIMDEERRTSLGLKAAITAARERLVFINTGFLDRTGDEIHTSMEAGPMLPKGEMKGAAWLGAYEDSNVDTGLECGLKGRAQIGKGMWAIPDQMSNMLATKIGHPLAGATCAWVPSPTAATLHATHYFMLSVDERQDDLVNRPRRRVADMITIPTLPADRTLTPEFIQRELENNTQGILGYVVRWVGQGVGCSTVPNVDDVGLMEDLATLRISSQHVANWLHHGVVSAEQVRSTMERMATVVDQQNSQDGAYQPMSADFDSSESFKAALALVMEGRVQPNGYTEAILRRHRRAVKAAAAS